VFPFQVGANPRDFGLGSPPTLPENSLRFSGRRGTRPVAGMAGTSQSAATACGRRLRPSTFRSGGTIPRARPLTWDLPRCAGTVPPLEDDPRTCKHRRTPRAERPRRELTSLQLAPVAETDDFGHSDRPRLAIDRTRRASSGDQTPWPLRAAHREPLDFTESEPSPDGVTLRISAPGHSPCDEAIVE